MRFLNDMEVTQKGFKSWSLVCASLLFSATTFEMLMLYGIVHWQVMFQTDPQSPRPPEAVFTVLVHLWYLRIIFALLALVWAIWSFRSCPKWASLIAVVVSLAALTTAGIIM
jgi:glucan phosphoethanolaminetransferase (alkaline phosphatase superfamily)